MTKFPNDSTCNWSEMLRKALTRTPFIKFLKLPDNFHLDITLLEPRRMHLHGKISPMKIAYESFAFSTTVQEGRERIVIAFFSWSPRVSFKNVFEAFEIQRLYCQKMLFPAQKGPCLTHFPSRTAFTESIS